MDAQEKYEYWLDIAQYDLDTAHAMYISRRWLYVAFMCEQAIEKLVKGLYTMYVSDNVPKTHNISLLFRKFESCLSEPVPEKQYDLFERLYAFYIDGRYTDYKAKLSASIDKEDATAILEQTKEAFSWLLTLKL
ncbi:MAG: HEPN domain-containing protein [Coriobacteriales bacterium]|nr:HEPN domain-containing protein [Coriobacteriales bacterium]